MNGCARGRPRRDASRIESYRREFEIAADGRRTSAHSSAVLSPGPRDGRSSRKVSRRCGHCRLAPTSCGRRSRQAATGLSDASCVRRDRGAAAVAGTVGATPTVVGRPSGVRPVVDFRYPPRRRSRWTGLAAPVLGVFLDRCRKTRCSCAARPWFIDRARTKALGRS
jgi:hypothetical protein